MTLKIETVYKYDEKKKLQNEQVCRYVFIGKRLTGGINSVNGHCNTGNY